MSLLLIDPVSKVFGTTLEARMLVGVIMILFYLCLAEMIHLHKPKEDLRKVMGPITIAMILVFILIIIKKFTSMGI